LTVELLRSPDVRTILLKLSPPLDADLIGKVAIGPDKWSRSFGRLDDFSPWETMMAAIVSGDAFGVDRIDYLLRDSYHAGVAYGRFDHHRLIDTLRILPEPHTGRLTIGIEKGGLYAAEAMQLARQFMFLQLYFHKVRVAYDIHIAEFLAEWLGIYPVELEGHLRLTDYEVLAAVASAAEAPGSTGHAAARRIARREHVRAVYQRNAIDDRVAPDATSRVGRALGAEFGSEMVRTWIAPRGAETVDFPVVLESGEVSAARRESATFRDVGPEHVGYVFIDPTIRVEAVRWLALAKRAILSEQLELDL